MSAAAVMPYTPTDRLGLAFFASILLHLVIVLGVSFHAPRVRMAGMERLEITLVQTRSARVPDKAQFLAQANQDGGGESERPDMARSPLPLLELGAERKHLPSARPQPQQKVPSTRELALLLTQEETARKKLRFTEPRPERKQARPEPERAGLQQPVTREERARLTAELDRTHEELQKAPRHKYLNARTQEYRYAAYMDSWRAKVERVGNLNYPQEAKRRGVTGSLVLDVALRADGSVEQISILRPSGHRILDEAARRIVEMAGPYAAFPPALRAEYDVVHITRTWRFAEALETTAQ